MYPVTAKFEIKYVDSSRKTRLFHATAVEMVHVQEKGWVVLLASEATRERWGLPLDRLVSISAVEGRA